jgi:phytoene synthase
MVMGVRERSVLLRASDLGIAFQLTNIVRDIVADAEVGRVYVPRDELRTAGLDAGMLTQPEHRAALFAVARDLLADADRYYASANAGLPHLPLRSAWAVAAARRVYRDIGSLVSRRRYRAWDARVSTSSARKFVGVVRAAGDAIVARTRPAAPCDRAGLYTPASLTARVG